MPKTLARSLAAMMSLALVAAACSGDDDGTGEATGGGNGETSTTVNGGEAIDYEELGLWDDGPCDTDLDPLVIGLMTVFESQVLSLGDQALALEASAEAFNARGGANGACIEVHTCDDGGTLDQSLACVRELDDAGVVATVNDTTTAGHAEVADGLSEAGIPRIATNVTPSDWGDPNAYPMDSGSTGVTFLLPRALIEEGVSEIGVLRVDQAAASALIGLLDDLYGDRATFPLDLPVPAGTTDYNQFVIAADDEGVGGVMLALGEQEATQLVRAGQQLDTDLLFGSSLGSFSHANVVELGGVADQMVFQWSFPPATFDLPVYEALRDDLAASGEDMLQPENLKASPMRSWIGLYALLRMIRDDGMTEFSRDGVTTMLDEATDVPMLGIYGGEEWTPSLDREGAFQRAGVDYASVYRWDPDAQGEFEGGNFVLSAEFGFDETLCGSPIGPPEPC